MAGAHVVWEIAPDRRDGPEQVHAVLNTKLGRQDGRMYRSLWHISLASPDLKPHDFTAEGTSERGEPSVTTSVAVPDIDGVAGYSDDPERTCLSPLYEYLR
jgi:hypothetical protein